MSFRVAIKDRCGISCDANWAGHFSSRPGLVLLVAVTLSQRAKSAVNRLANLSMSGSRAII
jgi:hypothetical protein